MALSPKILSIIQKAGTSIFTADSALKVAVGEAAKNLSDAMAHNSFDARHDQLYQNWKTIAMISQSMNAMEVELKKLYVFASDATGINQPTIALPPPVEHALEIINPIDVTDVVAKRNVRKSKAKTRVKKPLSPNKNSSQKKELGNTEMVWRHLQTALNQQTFSKLNQSAVAVAIGLPKGSIGMSIKKLLQDGRLIQGAGKDFKLR